MDEHPSDYTIIIIDQLPSQGEEINCDEFNLFWRHPMLQFLQYYFTRAFKQTNLQDRQHLKS